MASVVPNRGHGFPRAEVRAWLSLLPERWKGTASAVPNREHGFPCAEVRAWLSLLPERVEGHGFSRAKSSPMKQGFSPGCRGYPRRKWPMVCRTEARLFHRYKNYS